MRVSLVREAAAGERRVLLLPDDAQALAATFDLQVETGAGGGLNIDDSEYARLPARILPCELAWHEADFILKLKRPVVEEIRRMRPNSSIAALFHAEAAPDVVDELIRQRITAYSFEYFLAEDGSFPLMAATGEIAGQQAIVYAAYHLQSHLGGSGRQLSSCATLPGARVAVLGFGNVGRAAARLALALGAEVVVFRWAGCPDPVDIDGRLIQSYPCTAEILARMIPEFDVVIGAIRVSTFDTPPLLQADTVEKMRRGSVIVDVTAGFGAGYIQTSTETTTLSEPCRTVCGVKHIKIRTLPLGVHVTSAAQISRIYSPHILAMLRGLCSGSPYAAASHAIITASGRICHPVVERHYAERYHE